VLTLTDDYRWEAQGGTAGVFAGLADALTAANPPSPAHGYPGRLLALKVAAATGGRAQAPPLPPSALAGRDGPD